MKKAFIIILISLSIVLLSWKVQTSGIRSYYLKEVEKLESEISELKKLSTKADENAIYEQLIKCRNQLKVVDPLLRYMAPMQHKHINGPLPVEWETEVFEKFEKPYRRTGGGLYLFEQAISNGRDNDARAYLDMALTACKGAAHDSLIEFADKSWNSFYANRLFVLNLGSVYTTGFENPDASRVVAELVTLMKAQNHFYTLHNTLFPEHTFSKEYLRLYQSAVEFVQHQPNDISTFDHFTFLRTYVNPLYKLNANLIRKYRLFSRNLLDFSLNTDAEDIFDKHLYEGMDTKGYFRHIKDDATIGKIANLGEQWFFDPIFSGNLKRSCASCHKTGQYFTDTAVTTATSFDFQGNISRNAPSLLNVGLNHLAMHDGRFYTLSHQLSDVVQNPNELKHHPVKILQSIKQIPEYAKGLKFLSTLTPDHPKPEFGHVVSAIMTYYSSFDQHYSHFDSVMQGRANYEADLAQGFNLFMGKAACGTCHFVPHFGGVKPPYTGSEFEVLGTPADPSYSKLSADSGRYTFNPAPETLRAFRTPILRNVSKTAPYMHNGAFKTLHEVMDFYNAGGGTGKGFDVQNQTLASDSLHLTPKEIQLIIGFMEALDEKPLIPKGPEKLETSKNKKLNQRKPGGEY